MALVCNMCANNSDPNPFQGISAKMGTKPVLVGLYITILFTLIALFALLIMTPVLLKQMDQLTNEWERDFDGVKVGFFEIFAKVFFSPKNP